MTPEALDYLTQMLLFCREVDINCDTKADGQMAFRVSWRVLYHTKEKLVAEMSPARSVYGDTLQDALFKALQWNEQLENEIIRDIMTRRK